MRLAGTTLIFLMACADSTSLFIPSPAPVEGAASLVLFIEGEGQLLVGAVDVQADGQADILQLEFDNLSFPSAYTARAVFFTQPLDTLRIQRGQVPPAFESRSCFLQTPLQVQERRVTRSEDLAWSEVPSTLSSEELGHLFGTFDCALPDRCRSFRVESFAIDSDNTVGVIVPAGENRALVGATDQTYSWVTREGVMPAPEFMGAPSRASYMQQDGTLWLGGNRGRVTRGTVNDPGELVDVGLGRVPVIGLGGWEGPDGLELALATQPPEVNMQESFQLYYQPPGGEFRLVHDQLSSSVSSDQTRIHFLGPGRALIIFGGEDLLVLEGGEVFPVQIESLGFEVVGLAESEVHGIRLAADSGFLYRPLESDFRRWQRIEDVLLGTNLTTLLTFEDGFLFGGRNGIVGQHYPDASPCESLALGSSDVELMVPMGEDILMSGSNINEANPNNVTWLFRR